MAFVPIIPISSLPSLFDPQQAAQTGAPASGIPFADVLKDAMDNMTQTQAVSQQDSMDLALGRVDDLHTVNINSMKAEAAVSLFTGLTSKAISVYTEISRMQI